MYCTFKAECIYYKYIDSRFRTEHGCGQINRGYRKDGRGTGSDNLFDLSPVQCYNSTYCKYFFTQIREEVAGMKVSILIPISGRTLYLDDCLDSLKEQAFPEAEIILIDDNADGQLGSIVDSYKDSLNIQVIRPEEGKTGVAAARNAGLDAAKGEYIYFLDSDDYIFENAVEQLVLAADEQGADVAYGKKRSTWYKREIFIATYNAEQVESGEDEEDTAENAQLYAEESGDSRANSVEDADILAQAEDEENAREELSEEELARRKDARKRRAYRFMISSKKGITNISVLNILIRRSLIEEAHIRFAEQFKYFADLSFLIQVLSRAEVYARVMRAKYIKRKHNDPINFPSISQTKDPFRFEEYVEAYEYARGLIPEGCDLKERLDRQVINYYARTFAPRIRRAKDDSWREERFLVMHRLACQMDKETIRKLKGYKKRLMKALIKGDVKRSLRIVNTHLGYKKLKKILSNKRAFARFLYIHRFLKMPMKENWVICESFFGRYYSDSPKALYEYMSRTYPGRFRFIWVINDKKTKIPYPHTKVKRYTIRYAYYLARCKYNIFNVRQPMYVRKRQGNVFLETWHGTPLKKLVFDQDEVCGASPLYKEQVYRQSRVWDYLISPNHFSTEIFKSCFMFNKTILETGYPRNDILHCENRDELEAMFRRRLGIPEGKKTILYAPTWRDDEFYGKGEYKFALKLDLQRMKERLGEGYVVLLRTHYFIADAIDVSEYGGFVMNFCRYNDISELYLVSDILITDYSSVFFDYAGLRRPMIFYTYDLDKYRDILRGFYMSIEDEVPGPLAFTTDEVIDAILNIDRITKQYKEKYDAFYEKFCSLEDGHASEKVVNAVFGPALEEMTSKNP